MKTLEDRGFSVKIIADSIAPNGCRLTTVEKRYARIIHSEELTHKMFSKNSASSRAIPAAKMIKMIDEDPFVPIWWGKNEPGMQAYAEVEDKQAAVDWWLEGKRLMIEHARRGLEMGLHKQIVNRTIEPWMWITVISTFTDPANYLALRDHHAAEPHIQLNAQLLKKAMHDSIPRCLAVGEWHLPYINFDDEIDCTLSPENHVKVSVGRCARVSYLTHNGTRDPQEDIKLHDKLVVQEPLHASPAEHQAIAMPDANYYANFRGWKQYRKTLKNENVETKLGLIDY